MMDHYDCIVVGSGASGTAAASLVAKPAARRYLLNIADPLRHLHRTNRCCPPRTARSKRLGLLESLRHRHPRNRGLALFDHSGQNQKVFHFLDVDAESRQSGWHRHWQLIRMIQDVASHRGVENPQEHKSSKSFAAASMDSWFAYGFPVATCGTFPAACCSNLGKRKRRRQISSPSVQADKSTARSLGGLGHIETPSTSERRESAAGRRTHSRSQRLALVLPLSVKSPAWELSALECPLFDQSTAADVFEEQLVQCPFIAERLLQAELVSSLGTSSSAAEFMSPLFSFGLQLSCAGPNRLSRCRD